MTSSAAKEQDMTTTLELTTEQMSACQQLAAEQDWTLERAATALLQRGIEGKAAYEQHVKESVEAYRNTDPNTPASDDAWEGVYNATFSL